MRPDRKTTPLRGLTTYGASRAVRWDQYDYVSDAIVHLTTCSAAGKPSQDPVFAAVVCAAVEFRCSLHGYRLFGYCLMPDHLHVLLSPADSGVPIATWLARFKSFTGHGYAKHGGTPPLWQRSAYDHVCREGETAEAVLTYIVNNPVRAGLVVVWMEWKWTKVLIAI